jgi:hypothetical protein
MKSVMLHGITGLERVNWQLIITTFQYSMSQQRQQHTWWCHMTLTLNVEYNVLSAQRYIFFSDVINSEKIWHTWF